MALIKCRECGSEISSLAPVCPKCGCPAQIASASSTAIRASKKKASSKFEGCFGGGCILIVVIVIGILCMLGLKKNFLKNRDQILAQVKAAAEAGDQQGVLNLADKYEFMHDPDLDKYLAVAHAALKANEDKERAAQAKMNAIEQAAHSGPDFEAGKQAGSDLHYSMMAKVSALDSQGGSYYLKDDPDVVRRLAGQECPNTLHGEARQRWINGFIAGYHY